MKYEIIAGNGKQAACKKAFVSIPTNRSPLAAASLHPPAGISNVMRRIESEHKPAYCKERARADLTSPEVFTI